MSLIIVSRQRVYDLCLRGPRVQIILEKWFRIPENLRNIILDSDSLGDITVKARCEFFKLETGLQNSYVRSVPIPGGKSFGRLNFVLYRLIFVGCRYGTYFMPLFWRVGY